MNCMIHRSKFGKKTAGRSASVSDVQFVSVSVDVLFQNSNSGVVLFTKRKENRSTPLHDKTHELEVKNT